MIKQLLNSIIAKYRDLSVSRRSIICLSLRLLSDLLATDKSRYLAQPHPIIVKYLLPWLVFIKLTHLKKKNSRHLALKYVPIFVRGHYLFREANTFPRAKLEENCELRGTDNVQGQISGHIFAPNGGYCLYYPWDLFRNPRSFENWGIFSDIPQF